MDKNRLLCRARCNRALFACHLRFRHDRLLGFAQFFQQLLMNRSLPLFFFIIRCIAILSVVWLYFYFDAARYSFFPQCPFHMLTHLYCPGCGSQRSLSALLHGEIAKALSYNLLFVISLPLVIYSALVYTFNTFSALPVQQKLVYSPFFIKTCLWLVIAFFILRNIPFPLFSFLRPE